MKHGKGVIKFDSGETFDGQFENGQKHGKGTTNGVNQIITATYEFGTKNGPYEIKSKNG